MATDPALAPSDDENESDLALAWIERQKAWIKHENAQSDASEWDSLSWTWERFRYLTEYLPDKAWKVIKLIVSIDCSAEIIKSLIDEPHNDLLGNFGPEMIDLVEDEINRLPELQPLLSHSLQLAGRRATWVRSEFHGRARDGSIGQRSAPRDDEKEQDLARVWIDHYQAEYNSDRSNALLWSTDRMDYLVDYLPQKAWQIILIIWSMDRSRKTMGMLSAGPIENLLSKHGDETIELVEAEARRDPSFAKLLGGVWKHTMTDEVWARLQAVCDHRGWEGIPED
jgi:hypothetical protein